MKSMNFLEHFYNSPAGDRLVRDVAHGISSDIWEKNCLVFGYGEKFLDIFEAKELYYAAPSSDNVYHWPKIRPFKTIVADAETLPFPPGTWDVIIIIHYIEFSQRCANILKEVYRVLKPKGKLIIVSANKLDFLDVDVKKLNMSDIIAGLSETSFFINKIFGANRKLNFWPYRFSYNLNKYNETVMNFFPFLSDIVIISAEKAEKAPEIVSSFKEQYEMS